MNTTQPWTNEFLPSPNIIYLETAAHGVMPSVTRAAVEESIRANQHPWELDDDDFFALSDRTRQSIAKLIGGRAQEVALTTGASTGLQVIAHNLNWQRGDQIVAAAADFPVQYATWKPMEQRFGLEIKLVTPRARFLDADDIVAAISPRTRVVSVSHVRYNDASLLDLPPIAAACRAQGALLVADFSQSCGALPIDVLALGVDVAVCAGYKWLLSPYGTGFVWIRSEVLDRLEEGPFYWTGQDAPTLGSLNYVDPIPAREARRFDAPEMATSLNPNLMAFAASLELVLRIGPETVLEHNRQWLDAFFRQLPETCRPASPLDRERRGPFGCVASARPTESSCLHKHLRERGIFVSLRSDNLRVAPHLFNPIEQAAQVAAAIQEWR